MADGYDPQKSRVAEDTLADFLRAPLTGDLTEVPGIGAKGAEKLGEGEDAVNNTFMLIGKFLFLKVSFVVVAFFFFCCFSDFVNGMLRCFLIFFFLFFFYDVKDNSDETDDGLLTCAEHCDAFWFWLKSKGITAYRRCGVAFVLLLPSIAVVVAVAAAKKLGGCVCTQMRILLTFAPCLLVLTTQWNRHGHRREGQYHGAGHLRRLRVPVGVVVATRQVGPSICSSLFPIIRSKSHSVLVPSHTDSHIQNCPTWPLCRERTQELQGT